MDYSQVQTKPTNESVPEAEEELLAKILDDTWIPNFEPATTSSLNLIRMTRHVCFGIRF